MSALEVCGLRAGYGRGEVLRGIDLCVAPGAIVALLGANGAGKTTTFRALTGAIAASGEVRFGGRRLAGIAPEDAAHLRIAHVPEGRGTLAALSVRENLLLGAYTERNGRAVRERYARMLERFPKLASRTAQPAGTLSGGEQQMLAIARALMMEPQLLLLDEPSLGLAPLVVREVYAILREINTRDSVSMLVAEQNARLALEHASHAYVLEAGRVAVEGPAQTLIANDDVRRSYLGY
jgi:branched-chain amino acid transport system ATP-binding protein